MSKATDEDLGALHGAVARALTEVIADGVTEVIRGKGKDAADQVVKTPASPAYLAAAITFLKNNNITAAQGNTELDALKQALENKRKAKAPVMSQAALDEAVELFGQQHPLQ